jgi:hypothetical protein
MKAHTTKSFRPRFEALEERALMSVTPAPEMHINTTTFFDQSQVAVASQPVANGRSVTVWTSVDEIGSGGQNVKAQLFDGAGNRIGGELNVAGIRFKNENNPAVAMDAQGNFVVVWTEDVTDPGGDTMIRGQRFFASGAKNGGVLTIANDSRPESFPDVAMDQSGNFVVSYTLRTSTAPFDSDVLARRFSSNGTFLGSITVAGTSFAEYSSSVAMSPDGRFSIAYTVNEITSQNRIDNDIILKRFSASGGLLGRHDITTSNYFYDQEADVAMDRAGNAVVAYHRISSLTRDHDVVARKVFSNGAISSVHSIAVSPTFDANPTVAMDLSDGDYVVAYTWATNSDGSGMRGIIVTEMNANGTIKGSTSLGGNVGGPAAISINDSDAFFIAYTSLQRADDNGLGIRGRRGFLV